jgi:hypothetical protein
MKKRNFKWYFPFLIGAAFILLNYSAALAAPNGDCSTGGEENTCWRRRCA